jgi:hypothetical protein
MRYRLRTLLILLAVVPILLAGAWFAWPRIASFLQSLWETPGIKGLS